MFTDDADWDTPKSVKALNETIFKVGIICRFLLLQLLPGTVIT